MNTKIIWRLVGEPGHARNFLFFNALFSGHLLGEAI